MMCGAATFKIAPKPEFRPKMARAKSKQFAKPKLAICDDCLHMVIRKNSLLAMNSEQYPRRSAEPPKLTDRTRGVRSNTG